LKYLKLNYYSLFYFLKIHIDEYLIETAIALMGFMACSQRLDQTGMYLKNKYSVFNEDTDFRPYKVSLTRILRFRVGLVWALWLSLHDYLRFVLTFQCPMHPD